MPNSIKLSTASCGSYLITKLILNDEIIEKLGRVGIQKDAIIYVKDIKIKNIIILEINNISYAIRKEVADNIIVKKV